MRSARRRIGAGIVLILLAAACAPAGRPVDAGLPGARIRFVGPTDPTAIVDFSVALRLPGQAALDRFLHDAYDPASPSYRKFIDARTFGRRFGLSGDAIDEAERQLRADGFAVTSSFPQRTAVRLRGSVGDIERVFHVTLNDFVAGGVRFHAPAGEPTVPMNLSGSVVAVAGLDDMPMPTPRDIPSPNGLRPIDAARAYDISPLWNQGIRGQGQTVAIISFGTFREQDIATFDRMVGIEGAPAVERVSVDGGNSDATGGSSSEVNLDIDTVRGIAPQAQILNYEAPNRLSVNPDIYDRIVADGRADIVSFSYGLCDMPALASGRLILPAAERLREQQALQAMAAQGISLFVASGDSGAYDCRNFELEDQRPTVDFSSDSPFAIAVGGTLLSVRDDGSYLQETGWEDPLELSGAGGGLNPQDPRPDWQVGPGVNNRFSDGNRQVPDVAGPADPDSGFLTVHPGPGGRSVPEPIGGTSAAAPFWAGSMVLVRQYAARNGIDGLGFVDPMLYQLAATPQPFPPFHDVTLGGNLLYECTPGWDFATGLGSPDVWNLARDAVAYLSR